jgi:hypothetical protein
MTPFLTIKHIIIALTIQLLVLPLLNGQVKKEKADIIYKKDSSVLSVKITDITPDSVYYKAYWKDSKPIFSIPQTDISHFTFEDAFGTVYDIAEAQAVRHPSSARHEKADKIYKKDGSVISVSILRSLGDTLMCRSFWSKEGPIFGILKTEVDAISFKNGAMNCYTQRGVDTLLASIKQQKSFNGSSIPSQRNFGLSFNLGGPSFFGSLSMDLFLSRNFSLEFGAPLQLATQGFYGGAKLHIPLASKSNQFLSLYTGCILSVYNIPDTDGGFFPYFPLGLHSTNRKGFIFSIEAAVLRGDVPQFWGQVRFGKRFRRSAPVKK